MFRSVSYLASRQVNRKSWRFENSPAWKVLSAEFHKTPLLSCRFQEKFGPSAKLVYFHARDFSPQPDKFTFLPNVWIWICQDFYTSPKRHRPINFAMKDDTSATNGTGSPKFENRRSSPFQSSHALTNVFVINTTDLGPLEPAEVDFDAIRRWISKCDRDHGLACKSKHAALLPRLRVIDCDTREIVEMRQTGSSEYVALSYLWGEASRKPDENPSLAAGPGPRTIEDAIVAVRRLGLRYLWIDRYCIDQVDEVAKHAVIQNMDSIYEAAVLTIVAANGNDHEAGLTSSLSPTETGVTRFKIYGDEVEMWVGLRSPREEIRSSRWSTRGWTYQEGLLSRRRLVFTESHVYFQCRMMQHSQNLALGGYGGAGVSFRSIDLVFPVLDFQRDHYGILSRINEYSMRNLTFASDSLNAFLGVLRAYERLTSPVLHFWGLPLFHKKDATENAACLASSLLWGAYSDDDLTSPGQWSGLCPVPSLPSWSWAGWVGQTARNIVGRYDLYGLWAFHRYLYVDIDVRFGNSGTEYDFSEYASYVASGGNYSVVPPCLALTAWTTSVSFTKNKDGLILEDQNWWSFANAFSPDGVYSHDQEDKFLTGSFLAAVICWRHYDEGNWDSDRIRNAATPAASLVLTEAGPGTYKRVGILVSWWERQTLVLSDEGTGSVPDTGRVFKRQVLKIV